MFWGRHWGGGSRGRVRSVAPVGAIWAAAHFKLPFVGSTCLLLLSAAHVRSGLGDPEPARVFRCPWKTGQGPRAGLLCLSSVSSVVQLGRVEDGVCTCLESFSPEREADASKTEGSGREGVCLLVWNARFFQLEQLSPLSTWRIDRAHRLSLWKRPEGRDGERVEEGGSLKDLEYPRGCRSKEKVVMEIRRERRLGEGDYH